MNTAMGVSVADYDQDGRPDLFVTNNGYYNFLFHNLGAGRFDDTAFNAGVALVDNGAFVSGMGIDFRDFDNDGYPDIAFPALPGQTFPLFRNTGNGSFDDVTDSSTVQDTTQEAAITALPNITKNPMYYAMLEQGVVARDVSQLTQQSSALNSLGIGYEGRMNFTS